MLVLLSLHMRDIYLPLQLLLGLPCIKMRTYTPEEWKILSHVVLTPNMDWDSSVLKFNAAEYYEWLENMVAGMELQSMLYTK